MTLLWVWGGITAVALIVECILANLVVVWFGAGSLVDLLVVALIPKLAVLWQFVIFMGVSIVLLASTRRLCVNLLQKAKTPTSNSNKK